MRQRRYGDRWGDAQTLFDTVAASLKEMEGDTLGDTLTDAQALVEKLSDSLAKLEAETQGNT